MNEHVSIKRTKRRQHFPTETAVVDFCLSGGIGWVRRGLDFIVPAKMACELFEGCHVFRTERAFEISCFLTLIRILE